MNTPNTQNSETTNDVAPQPHRGGRILPDQTPSVNGTLMTRPIRERKQPEETNMEP